MTEYSRLYKVQTGPKTRIELASKEVKKNERKGFEKKRLTDT